jgi:hypothetical protein
VGNRRPVPVSGRIGVYGGLVLAPTDIRITLAPGETRLLEVHAELAPGTPPGLHRASVIVAADGQPPRATDIELAIAGADQFAARLTRTEPSGGSVGRTAVELVNRSTTPVEVMLDAHCAVGRVDLASSRVVVGPATTTLVRATIRAPGPTVGARRRLPFVVDVDGAGGHSLVGTFVQKPLLSGSFAKVLLVVSLLTAWAIGLVVLLTSLR